ncbi:sensor histidine kinase [Paenibacillus eucommiae]|uniref:Two-component system sensor histidine kinase YesM n=1 Tax=Paenibacillus eucommiae TaxID=1355755 RepID=A0ABS4J400_9BACL|nr:histidine kinase [Paenibacillus eucommiae]MBP1994530.1 two-component system sensor histidine kinase YesM [Paenibacillus eucommiae]
MHIRQFFSVKYGIFFKLLTAFLIIVVPIYLISSFMYRSGVDTIREQIMTVMQQKADFLVSSMDSELKRTAQLQVQFINDSDLQDLSIRSESLRDYERFEVVNDLQSKLRALASSSRYVKDAFVMMPHYNKKLSSLSQLTDMDKSEYETFREARTDASGLAFIDNRYFLLTGYPVATNTQYMLIIELSIDNIDESLGNSAYIKDEEHNLILAPANFNENLETIENDSAYLTLTKQFSFNNKWSLVTINEEAALLEPVNAFKKWNSILSALAVLVILIASYLLFQLIHRPLKILVQAFKKVESGQFDLNLEHKTKDEFEYLYHRFNHMVAQLKVLVQQVYEQTIRRQQAELKQLQSQINPHFLYNSLYVLYRLAQDKDFNGVSYLSKYLGDYFKFITQNKTDDVALDKEIEHARVYASIQQMRFGNRLSFHWEVPEDLSQWEVPRLIFQPLLENAVVHGHRDTFKDGIVRIAVTADEKRLELQVEDNGIGMTGEQLKEWESRLNRPDEMDDHALWNIHRRLQLRYGEGSGLELKNNPERGLIVTLVIQREEA